VVHQFRLGNERNESFVPFLQRLFTSKRNKITRNTFVQFRFPKIEGGAFDQVHKNVVVIVANAQKTLDDGRVSLNGQFEYFSVSQVWPQLSS
jgi:hypothetical protein